MALIYFDNLSASKAVGLIYMVTSDFNPMHSHSYFCKFLALMKIFLLLIYFVFKKNLYFSLLKKP